MGLIPLRADTGMAPWRGVSVPGGFSFFPSLRLSTVIFHRSDDSHFPDVLEEDFCRSFQSLQPNEKNS